MSGLGFLDGERVVFEAQTVHEMAEAVRKMKANNTELGASLEAALNRIDEAAAIERQRIVNMLTRFAVMDEDGGDLAAAEVQRVIVREIEALRHLGQDGDPFVAVETEQ